MRTSQGILELIPNHLSCQSGITLIQRELKPLQDFLSLHESRRIHTYVMSSSTSQEALLAVLKSFFHCQQTESPSEVLILVADMNELTRETISHARILIEETECSYQQLKSNKFVFLLLHFPSNMFYSHCYSSLFLEGWHHMYLGRAGEMQNESSIDIEKWLAICLLQKEETSLFPSTAQHTLDDNFVSNLILTEWLSENIVLISRSFTIKQLKNFPDKDVDNIIIRYYFTKVLLNSKISKAIKERFHEFWQQEAIHKLTFQIACYAMAYHSSCTLSQTVQETIQSSFKDLVLLFFCIMNQNLVFHTILCNDMNNDDSIIDLVCKILSFLPLPDSLQQLQLDVNILMQQSHRDCTNMDISSPRFPFFALVFDAMEEIVNKAFRYVVQPVDSLEDPQLIKKTEVVSQALNLLDKTTVR